MTLRHVVLACMLFALAPQAPAQDRGDDGGRKPKRDRGQSDDSGNRGDDRDTLRDPRGGGGNAGGNPGQPGGDPRFRPDNNNQPWNLGVRGTNTTTGVRVTEVLPNSVAARTGLERDDVIVAVSGYQVGTVGGRTYDLDEELQQRADRSGRVTLLIQNRRDRALISREVALQRGAPAPVTQTLRGTATYRDRSAMPADATLTVKIVEKRLFGGGKVIAEASTRPRREVPIPFELQYETSRIDEDKTYVLEATISAGGRTIYVQSQEYPVITKGKPVVVDIVLRRT